MPNFDWNDFYTLAHEISFQISDGDLSSKDYARIRTCVSRVYYAAFHKCRIYLNEKHSAGIEVEGAHKDTVAKLSQRDAELSRSLGELKTARHKADYHNDFGFAKQSALDALQKCEEIKYEIDERIRQNK